MRLAFDRGAALCCPPGPIFFVLYTGQNTLDDKAAKKKAWFRPRTGASRVCIVALPLLLHSPPPPTEIHLALEDYNM